MINPLCELCYPGWKTIHCFKADVMYLVQNVDADQYGIVWGNGHENSVFIFPQRPTIDILEGKTDEQINALPYEDCVKYIIDWPEEANTIQKPLMEWLGDITACWEFVNIWMERGYKRKDGFLHMHIYHECGKIINMIEQLDQAIWDGQNNLTG